MCREMWMWGVWRNVWRRGERRGVKREVWRRGAKTEVLMKGNGRRDEGREYGGRWGVRIMEGGAQEENEVRMV